MRQHDVRGREAGNCRFERGRIRVGGVRFEQRRVNHVNRPDRRLADFGGGPGRIRPQDNDVDRLIGGELLRRRDRFPRRPMQLTALLLGDDNDHPITLASSFNL
jgi:hypothetical protein